MCRWFDSAPGHQRIKQLAQPLRLGFLLCGIGVGFRRFPLLTVALCQRRRRAGCLQFGARESDRASDKLKYAMPPTLNCPSAISEDSFHRFLHLREQVRHLVDDHLVLECAALKFVDPLGLCLLHHWFSELKDRNVHIDLRSLHFSIESYAVRMDLFKHFENVTYTDRTSGNGRSHLIGNLVELQAVTSLRDIGAVASQLAGAVVHGIPDISFKPDADMMHEPEGTHMVVNLEYVFSEILQNALDHGRKRGSSYSQATIAAQYYATKKRLSIAIVDNGCGLFQTLQSHPRMENIMTDLQAIKTALEPGVSCNLDLDLGLDSKNQGIGLTVSSRMALAANGRCTVFSGDGGLRSIKTARPVELKIPVWQGTGVCFEFDRGAMLKMDKGAVIRALPGFREEKNIVFS